MGTEPSKDTLLFGQELGKDKILEVGPSEDDSYVDYTVLHGSGSEQSEVYVQNLKEHEPIVPVVNDQKSLFSLPGEETRCFCKPTGRYRNGTYTRWTRKIPRGKTGKKSYRRPTSSWKT
jgi:hypothetical protein